MIVKILGIHSSPNVHGATAQALQFALDCAAQIEGVETEFVGLGRKVNPCLHCDACIKKQLYYCPIYDDAIRPLYDKIQEADGIILASPVYDMAPNAQMSMLVNRMRPLGKLTSTGGWAGKVGCAIAVGGARNGGEETSLAVMNRFLLTLGMTVPGPGVYAYSGAGVWSRNRNDESILEDTHNRMALQVTARRMAVLAKVIQTGLGQMPELEGCQLAGFLDQADRQKQLEIFWKKD